MEDTNSQQDNTDIEAFITRWAKSGGAERANYALFLSELCDLLGVSRPDPATPDNSHNDYVLERSVEIHRADGSTSTGFIDFYKRGCFVLETKQGVEQEMAAEPLTEAEKQRRAKRKQGHGKRGTRGWDEAMLRARSQAQRYSRALPAEHGRPPFVIVVDVGHSIDLYAEFTRSGGEYVAFPDPLDYRITLEQLRQAEVRELLKKVWTDPLTLDPVRTSARVTRNIAARLAELAKRLEADGLAPERVAEFLMRSLFTMFAEDIGMLPELSFTRLLEELREHPQRLQPLLRGLWKSMNEGGFSPELREDILRFNGGLFAKADPPELDREQIELLLDAARADWRQVEPAIFGTLLERALDKTERHKLGAHYTPRAYVERLVMPTVIEPLREQWSAVQAAALTLEGQGKHDEALDELRLFHRHLCEIKVLDPACGSGNFLYVTLEHLKRLEGEVLNILAEIGETQGLLEMEGVTVDPHQFLGLEVNPRAATIAEMVLWIGYLQWHFRSVKKVQPPEPVLKDFHNIECRDAVLDWDAIEDEKDDDGEIITRWDGRTYKQHTITGEQVPDETARVPLEKYINPRMAGWPTAEYVVGNPPFIGKLKLRQALGDGYVEALRSVYDIVPDSADYVMYWWHKAAELARAGEITQFGLITTKGLSQTYNRRVVEHHMTQAVPLSVVYAISNHPWVDSSDGAAVRIGMTVGKPGDYAGSLMKVVEERAVGAEVVEVGFDNTVGKILPDLTIGADVVGASQLVANRKITATGVIPHGAGMMLTEEQALAVGLGRVHGLERHIRPYSNGRDLNQRSRNLLAIDLYPLTINEVQERFPELYQWLLLRVKPERDHNRDKDLREKWWLHRRGNEDMRDAIRELRKYIATVLTSKQRTFVFVDGGILPDQTLVVIGSDDSYILGVLSSRAHIVWALRSGSKLGVGNDPRYNKTRCFETFPFPCPTEDVKLQIQDFAGRIDAHRKRQQSIYTDLTLTGMYNVLEKLRRDEKLTNKEKTIHERGLVSVLAQLHDELDTAVFASYGWSDLSTVLVGKPGGTTPYSDKPEVQSASEEDLLSRLVALNAERAAEEARGTIRWLRPEYQNPEGRAAEKGAVQTEAPLGVVAAKIKKRPWPKTLPEQVQAVRFALSSGADSIESIAAQFTRARRERVEELLATLTTLGQVHQLDDGRYHSI